MDKLLSFSDFSTEKERLDERLIQLNNGAKYNQVVILAGGAGSGKGFAISKFIDSSSYQVRDVDEVKKLLQKISAKGKLDAKKIWQNADKSKMRKSDIDTVNRTLSSVNYRLDRLNLREPDHVFTLHIITDIIGWKDKTLALLAKTSSNGKYKPNLLFDATSKSRKSLKSIVDTVLAIGYEPKNIHLIWVLTDFKLAIINNAQRDRVVPEDIMLQTHAGAANTMTDIFTGSVPDGIDGAIWVILNNKENTIYWRHGDGKLRKTPEFHEDDPTRQLATAKIDQEMYDRIYGKGAFAKKAKREGDKAGKEQLVVKSFARILAKKPGKQIGDGVLPFKTQLFNWIIKNVPSNATKAIRKAYGVILGKEISTY